MTILMMILLLMIILMVTTMIVIKKTKFQIMMIMMTSIKKIVSDCLSTTSATRPLEGDKSPLHGGFVLFTI